jgi:hypothetical protein
LGEILVRFVAVALAQVQIADGIESEDVVRIRLDDFQIFADRLLDLPMEHVPFGVLKKL